MAPNNSERRTAICLILLSAVLGLLVRPFYDWTGADQSRPVALLWQVPLSISAALGIFGLALPWIPIKRDVEFERRPLQFSLRFLLLATGAIAVLLGTGIRYPNVFTGIVGLSAVLMVVHSWWRFPVERWSISALLAAMYLPYGWFLFIVNLDLIPRFIWFATCPSFLPYYFAVTKLPLHTTYTTGTAIGMALTSLELAVGLVLIHLGPKRGIAFVVFALSVSLLGAVALDMVLRM